MKVKLEKKVVVAAVVSVLVPVVAGVLPQVEVSALEAVIGAVVNLAATFVAGYFTKHTKRPDLPVEQR